LAGGTTVLCGRNAVQVTPVDAGRLEFAALAPRLTTAGATEVRFNAFMLKARVETFDLTLFPDGRAIIAGTRSPEQARTLYARYIGA